MNKSIDKRMGAALLVTALIFLIELVGIPGTSLTKSQEITVGILLIAATLWVSEWVPLFIVSFLILALELVWLLPVLKIDNPDIEKSIFFGSFFSNIILLFLGGFVLSSMMQKFGIDLMFAQKILEHTQGNAKLTLLGIIATCSFLSMWISNTATTAMMLTIIFPLIKHIPENNSFRIALVLCIPFACNIGGIGTPIGTPPNAIALSYLSQLGINISFAKWMALTLPFMIFFLLVLWRLLIFLYPSGNLVLKIKERQTTQFGIKQKSVLSIFALTAIGWLIGGYFGLQTGTVALFPVIVCFWFGLLDTADFRKLPWDILYIISGGLALGVALNASGLGQVMVSALPSSPTAIMIVGIMTAAAMSTVMSNTATAGLIIPLVSALDSEMGAIVSLVVGLALSCSMAMALPVTTPPNAIAFSSRAIRTKDMVIGGGLMTIISVIVVLLIGPQYWALFF